MKATYVVVAAILLVSPMAHAEAQTLGALPPPPSDSLLTAHLKTQADTVALLHAMLPAALDSLRRSSDSLSLGALVEPHRQLSLSPALGAGLDSAWLAGLIHAGLISGVCRPVRISCRDRAAISVRLENQPGVGDNAVRIALSVTSGSQTRRRRTVAPYQDDNARMLRLWELGVFQPQPVLMGGPHVLQLIPRSYLLVERTTSGWHVKGWFN